MVAAMVRGVRGEALRVGPPGTIESRAGQASRRARRPVKRPKEKARPGRGEARARDRASGRDRLARGGALRRCGREADPPKMFTPNEGSESAEREGKGIMG